MSTAGLRVDATGLDDPRLTEVPGSIQVALDRVAQEALTNALRHSSSAEAAVAIRVEPERITLSVVNGSGVVVRPESGIWRLGDSRDDRAHARGWRHTRGGSDG